MIDRSKRRPGRSMLAPWWVYVVVIVGANYLRQMILPFGTVPEWADAAIALMVAAVGFVLISAVHRAMAGR